MITVTFHPPTSASVLLALLGFAAMFAVFLMYWLCHYTLTGCEVCEQRLTMRKARASAQSMVTWCRRWPS